MINRRDSIKALGAVLGVAALPQHAPGAQQCGPAVPPFGVQACVAGIPEERLDTAFAFQQRSEWCWAACIQMVFAYWGHSLDQKEIVRQTWGTIANMPGQPIQIIRDLNRSWTDEDGDSFTVRGDVFSANAATAAQDLANERPLIIGSLGHAMVLTAVSFNRTPAGAGQITGAIVRDPLPGRGERRELTPLEAAATMLLVRIRIS